MLVFDTIQEEPKKRKTTRLKKADYSNIGAYFITICTKERRRSLSEIVGTGVLDGPQGSPCSVELLPYGNIAEKILKQLSSFYDNITVDKYVIMPNHIHLMLSIKRNVADHSTESGPSGTPVPTVQNSTVSRFISTFKRFCNKEIGQNIWQYRSYDHIIRNKEDYDEVIKYIHNNPLNWVYDRLYTES